MLNMSRINGIIMSRIKKKEEKEWYKAQGCHLNSDGGISYGSYDSY